MAKASLSVQASIASRERTRVLRPLVAEQPKGEAGADCSDDSKDDEGVPEAEGQSGLEQEAAEAKTAKKCERHQRNRLAAAAAKIRGDGSKLRVGQIEPQ